MEKVAVTGSTLPAKAQQLLADLCRSHAGTLAGFTLLVAILVLSVGMMLNGYGFFSATAIEEKDRLILNAADENTSSKDIVHEDTSIPVRMIFPDIDLAHDVIDSEIIQEKNYWPLSESHTHYANFTAKLGNESGTMLLYGHNSWSVLRHTHKLSLGSRLVLQDDKGVTWSFELVKEETVTPDKVGFIYDDVPFRVVVLTCDGWHDEYRRLMFFEPTEHVVE